MSVDSARPDGTKAETLSRSAFRRRLSSVSLSAWPASASTSPVRSGRYRPLFKKVMPVEYARALAEMAKEKAATMQAAE